MTEYHFRLIVSGPFPGQLSDEELLDVTDALGATGCDDCSIQAVEEAGYVVESVQMDRDAVLSTR
jgi:hypothetical protein